MRTRKAVVVGAGIAGLVAAVELASAGVDVVVVERQSGPGGKLRQVAIGDALLDAGPTVFTLRFVFDAVFAAAGTTLEQHLTLVPAEVLARHAWSGSERLDLFADIERSADAIGRLAGPAEARGYRSFCERSRRIYDTLQASFMTAQQPGNALALARRGAMSPGAMLGISPFTTMWSGLGAHFRDPRLLQMFGRYATYCGSSPWLAPATLMLVAHAEQAGVWMVQGGMQRIAQALAALAQAKGVDFRYDTDVAELLFSRGRACGVRLASGERIDSDSLVFNGETAALAGGLAGRAAVGAVGKPDGVRSLSALTWMMVATPVGFPLLRHNVFFSKDYAAEFRDLFEARRLPLQPTIYVCAQDRGDTETAADGPERLMVLANAPATGDTHDFNAAEIAACERATFDLLGRCGLILQHNPQATVVTTPNQWSQMFPATGGALYGRATHGAMAAFRRPGARSKIPGLYLAGGSAHPGPGLPMAAQSGRLAAAALLEDLTRS